MSDALGTVVDRLVAQIVDRDRVVHQLETHIFELQKRLEEYRAVDRLALSNPAQFVRELLKVRPELEQFLVVPEDEGEAARPSVH